MKSDPDVLQERHRELVQSDMRKVVSHVQREVGDWIINTLMVEDYSVPFRYKRQRRYKSLAGAVVNLTYYAATQQVAGIEMEVMNVVRVTRS